MFAHMKNTVVGLAVWSIVLFAQVAEAGIPVTDNFFVGPQWWSDNSGDKLVNFAGGESTVDVGDVLLCGLDIATAEQGANLHHFGQASLNVNELSGLIAIEAIAKVPMGGSAYLWAFAPVSDTKRSAISVLYPTVGAALATWQSGTMAAMYEDETPDFDRQSPPTDLDHMMATAIDGQKLWEFGFTGSGGTPMGGTGQGWTAFALSDDILFLGSRTGNGGFVNIGVDLITHSGFEFDKVWSDDFTGWVDIAGSGSLLGKSGFSSPYDIFDDFNLQVNVAPEPGSLVALAGMSVAGLFGLVWRRRRTNSGD